MGLELTGVVRTGPALGAAVAAGGAVAAGAFVGAGAVVAGGFVGGGAEVGCVGGEVGAGAGVFGAGAAHAASKTTKIKVRVSANEVERGAVVMRTSYKGRVIAREESKRFRPLSSA
jgi:hypothetical protein